MATEESVATSLHVRRQSISRHVCEPDTNPSLQLQWPNFAGRQAIVTAERFLAKEAKIPWTFHLQIQLGTAYRQNTTTYPPFRSWLIFALARLARPPPLALKGSSAA